jgi:RNA 3'-terminal phosphate cyclase (ATP)
VSRLPKRIATTETAAVCEVLGWRRNCCIVEAAENTFGPGNILTVEIESEHITEVFTGFGRRGVPAEEVGRTAANAAKAYLDSEAPVGPYLADQLMIPFVMAKGGFFRTMPLSRHAETNIDVIKQFLDLEIRVTEPSETVREVRILADKE